MTRQMTALSAGALALGLLASPAFAATEMVTNGGFETGDFSGWTVGYTGDRNVCCMGFTDTGTHVAANGANLASALSGVYSAYGDWDGGDASYPVDYNGATYFWIRQALTKTTDVTSATLTFQFQVAGGAYEQNPAAYGGEILKRNVTANFLGADLSPLANLYTYERALLNSQTPPQNHAIPIQTITLDVTTAYNAMGDGGFFLDFSRRAPQYFTGAGYFVLDSVSLKVGDAVTPTGPGIPEPGAWALMILGFGGAGSALRRRRTIAAA